VAVEASGTGMSEAPAGNAVTVVASVGMLDSEETGCGVSRLAGDPGMDVANNGISFDEAEGEDRKGELDQKEELEEEEGGKEEVEEVDHTEEEGTEEPVNEDEGIDGIVNGEEE